MILPANVYLHLMTEAYGHFPPVYGVNIYLNGQIKMSGCNSLVASSTFTLHFTVIKPYKITENGQTQF